LHRIITIIIKDSKERKNLEKDWIPAKLYIPSSIETQMDLFLDRPGHLGQY
jgi:hypothetical protein